MSGALLSGAGTLNDIHLQVILCGRELVVAVYCKTIPIFVFLVYSLFDKLYKWGNKKNI